MRIEDFWICVVNKLMRVPRVSVKLLRLRAASVQLQHVVPGGLSGSLARRLIVRKAEY